MAYYIYSFDKLNKEQDCCFTLTLLSFNINIRDKWDDPMGNVEEQPLQMEGGSAIPSGTSGIAPKQVNIFKSKRCL